DSTLTLPHACRYLVSETHPTVCYAIIWSARRMREPRPFSPLCAKCARRLCNWRSQDGRVAGPTRTVSDPRHAGSAGSQELIREFLAPRGLIERAREARTVSCVAAIHGTPDESEPNAPVALASDLPVPAPDTGPHVLGS